MESRGAPKEGGRPPAQGLTGKRRNRAARLFLKWIGTDRRSMAGRADGMGEGGRGGNRHIKSKAKSSRGPEGTPGRTEKLR